MTEMNPILDAQLEEILCAIVARLIPADDLGPGAIEARVDRYICAALAGPLSSCLPRYVSGLQGVNALATGEFGGDFVRLPASVRDEVLRRLEVDAEAARAYSAEGFFDLVREHTIEGFLGDPKHGGNRDAAGWKLIGYTPLGRAFSPAQQGLQQD
ncbi:MAG: gluconate 2-dehydrogenase subunit 3 family protein [Bauldia sp.]